MAQSLYSIWKKTAKERAGKTALILTGEGRRISFTDLQAAVKRELEDSHLTEMRNRIVAIQMSNSPGWLVAFLACQAVGAIAMPLERDLPEAGRERIFKTLRPGILWDESGRQAFAKATRRQPACLIKLTSGSTGQPKPLFFEDAQMLADAANIVSTMGIAKQDINLAAIPFGHSYGLGNLIMPLITQGTAIAICDNPFPHGIANAVESSRATVFPAVPTLIHALTRADVEKRALASLKQVISAGSPLAPADARAFKEKFRKKIHNFYGSSETGGISYDRTGKASLTGESVGLPLENVHVLETRRGRLLVASKAVMKRGNPRRSGRLPAILLPDVGRVREDGSVQLLGRQARIVKIAGKRLNLHEVENVIQSIKGVDAVYVAVNQSEDDRGKLAAVYIGKVDPRTIRTSLKKLLPGWKIPARWLKENTFPVNARGKVDYRQLDKRLNQS